MKDEFREKLGQLKATGESRPGPDCPADTNWLNLAAGLLSKTEAIELQEHATGCDACSVLLRQATEDLAEELQKQEREQLELLKSAQPQWQHVLAHRLAAQRPKEPKASKVWAIFPSWKPRPAFPFAWAYAAAAVVLLAAGIWVIQEVRQPSLEHLIASAYTEKRPFELRIDGAAYGEVRIERGGERSSLGQPAALLRAKYLLKEKLAAHPDDTALLTASGKIELLDGNFEAAIHTFGRLLDAHPDSPAMLTDLATAYFQRAEAEDRAADYGQAVELLSRALAKNPDEPVALFNRAIALERMYAHGEAIRDWEHYLRVDPSSEWAAEAQRRLSELREKVKVQEKPAALQADPAKAAPLLRARAAGHSTTVGPWPVALDEEYQDLAVREWLPSLYVSADSTNQKGWRRDPVVGEALSATSDVLLAHHGDRWLADFLQELPGDSSPPDFVQKFVAALDTLGRAARANAAGDPDSARPLADSAKRSFRAVRSMAGALRAREESVYSLVRGARATQARDCIQAAGEQLEQAQRGSYAWLQGQALLWHATCAGAKGNVDLAQRLSGRALEFTRSTGYAGQHLRCVLFASGFLRSTVRNWQYLRVSLERFWAVWHNPFHAYESYSELAIVAEDEGKWHLAHLLNREALRAIQRTPDRSFEAITHYYLAVAAVKVGNLDEAESEYRLAAAQLAALPNFRISHLYKADLAIHLAAVELQQDKLHPAEAHLEQARPHLQGIATTWTAFNYHRALGQLHARRKNLAKAETALWSAVEIGEARLGSLQSDADRLAWDRDASGAYRELVEMYARQPDGALRALEVWEWYRSSALRGSAPLTKAANPGANNSNTGPGPPALSQVAETLPALRGETVVSYARLRSGVAAWGFDNRGVHFAWIGASEEELARQTKHFAFLCADPSSDLETLRQEGRDLYDLLLAPFERFLNSERVLVVEPDSILSEVPWPALVDSRGVYLGSKFAIIISPGFGYWLNLRLSVGVSPEQRALVVGMPALAAGTAARFAPLPDADREARRIATRFRYARLLSGKEASPEAIREEMARSTVFHFAGHAVSGVKRSGLVLASPSGPDENADQPTLLSASDLDRALLQRLQLVVLSACATAETEKGFGDPDTLVRGFLRSGVPHVVASRWPVDSGTTEKTMTGFYARLFQGLAPAEALQDSANSLLTQPGTAHPYYWAAFSTFGR